MDTEICRTCLVAMATTIRDNRDALSALDAALGDGDHGFNMDAAMQAIIVATDGVTFDYPAELFKVAGNVMMNEMGGASGIIFGSFFAGGARAVKERSILSVSNMVQFFEQGIVKVQKRGKATVGDKTLVDALVPALSALKLASKGGLVMADAMQAAADAAAIGAESTKALVAQHGRAKFMGKRSLDHQDAGATSMALLLNAWAECLKESVTT